MSMYTPNTGTNGGGPLTVKSDTAISSQFSARRIQGGYRQFDCRTERLVAGPVTKA